MSKGGRRTETMMTVSAQQSLLLLLFFLAIVLCASSAITEAFQSQFTTMQRRTKNTPPPLPTTSFSANNKGPCHVPYHVFQMQTTSSVKEPVYQEEEEEEEEDVESMISTDELNKVILDSLINTTTTTTTTSITRTTTEAAIKEPLLPQQVSTNETDIKKNHASFIIMAILCWLVACLSALDRVSMSVAMLPLSAEFGFSETTKGQISSLFSVGYGLFGLPVGLYMSLPSTSPTKVLGIGILLWSAATLATPLLLLPISSSTTHLVVPLLLTTRALVGAAEAVVLPSLQKLMSNWVSPQQKSLAVAGVFSGFQAGTVAAYLASPLIMEILGNNWRGLFYTYGGMGMFLLIPWFVLARDVPPESQQTILANKSAERRISSTHYAAADTEQLASSSSSSSSSWKSLLRSAPWKGFCQSKGFWAMTIAHAANNWGLYNNLAWTPTFYAEQYGLNVRDSAWLSVLPSVTGAVGGLVAGALADAIIKKMEQQQHDNDASRTLIRKVFQGIALYGPAIMLTILSIHIPQQPLMAQSLLMATVGLQAFNAAGYGAANQEKAGEKWSGLLYSLTSLPGVAVGSFAVYATGHILDVTHDWSNVFGLNALVNVVGATAFVLLYNSKQEWD